MTALTATTEPLAVIASSDAEYARLGLARDDIKPWEDGARTDDRPGTYEWWYFDAHLDDGTKLVVVFMDKDLITPQKPLEPTIRLNLDLADGRSFVKFVKFDSAAWVIGLSRSTISELARSGTIPSLRVGSRVLVPVKALE